MNLLAAIRDVIHDHTTMSGGMMDEEKNPKEILQNIVEKATNDSDFRRKLLKSPNTVLAQNGFPLPEGFTIKFVEETEDAVFIPIPPYMGEQPEKTDQKKVTLMQLIQRTALDQEFRRLLIQMPRAVLMSEGFDVPSDKKMVILEATEDFFYVVLPPFGKSKPSGAVPFEYRIKDGMSIILRGRLDALAVEQLRPIFFTWKGDLILDFSKVDYISSAGLGLLLLTYKHLKKTHRKMQILNVQGPVRNLIVISGFDAIFNL